VTRQIDTYVINKATLEILDMFHFIFVRMGANLWVRMRLGNHRVNPLFLIYRSADL
jgi:hypothetical protein